VKAAIFGMPFTRVYQFGVPSALTARSILVITHRGRLSPGPLLIGVDADPGFLVRRAGRLGEVLCSRLRRRTVFHVLPNDVSVVPDKSARGAETNAGEIATRFGDVVERFWGNIAQLLASAIFGPKELRLGFCDDR